MDEFFVYHFSNIPRKVYECAQVGIQLTVELLRSRMPCRQGHLVLEEQDIMVCRLLGSLE